MKQNSIARKRIQSPNHRWPEDDDERTNEGQTAKTDTTQQEAKKQLAAGNTSRATTQSTGHPSRRLKNKPVDGAK